MLLVIDCDEVERGHSSSAYKGAAGPPGHLSGRVGKSLYYFHKKIENLKHPKKTKNPFLVVFLGGFFGWVFHCQPGF